MQLEFARIVSEATLIEVAETQLDLDLPQEEASMVQDKGMNFEDFGDGDVNKKKSEKFMSSNNRNGATGKNYPLAFFGEKGEFIGGFTLESGHIGFEGNIKESAHRFGEFLSEYWTPAGAK